MEKRGMCVLNEQRAVETNVGKAQTGSREFGRCG